MAKRKAAKANDAAAKRVAEPAQSFDAFTNLAARMGFGSPSLAEQSEYSLLRISNNYGLMLSLYRNHWIARRIVEGPAQDMVKAWPKITSEMTPEDAKLFDRRLARTATKSSILQTMKWARLFGGAGALIVIDGHAEMLDQPLDWETIYPGSYKGLIPFDRWSGITPTSDICTDIALPLQFGLPESYQVMSGARSQHFKVHASRILRFVGPDVPNPEQQAQNGWGISVLEVVYEELKKRDNMSWAILQLLFRAQIIAQKNGKLDQMLSGAGATQAAMKAFWERMEAQNHLLSNQSMMILPADGGLETHAYTFGGVADVYQQFQLDIAGAAQMPVTRLFGRTISGLGQSNDADIQVYEDMIAMRQHEELRPQLERLFPVIFMSEFGEVPEDLDFDFPSMRQLSEKDKYELAKTGTEAVLQPYQAGVYSQRTALMELRNLNESTGMFGSITDEMIEEADDDVQAMGDLSLGDEEHDQEKGDADSQSEEGSKDGPSDE